MTETRNLDKVHLSARVRELEAAIEKHFSQSVGQAQCWENDEELWSVLNDGTVRKYPHSETPSYEEMMAECDKYCRSRQFDTVVVIEVTDPEESSRILSAHDFSKPCNTISRTNEVIERLRRLKTHDVE